jgi:hypothetical protein
MDFTHHTMSPKMTMSQRGLATLCFGDDVVYNHWLAGIGFGCLTISATVVVYFNQLLAQFGRYVLADARRAEARAAA